MEYLANHKTKLIQIGTSSDDGSFIFDSGNPSTLSKRVIDDPSSGYAIFDSYDEAKKFFKRMAVKQQDLLEFENEERQALRRLEEIEAKEAMHRRQEHISLMYEIKANILKEFRIAAFNVSTPVLKKAMFTITGNKQFNRWGYNPSTDDDVFRFITVEQMEELFELLNHT